ERWKKGRMIDQSLFHPSTLPPFHPSTPPFFHSSNLPSLTLPSVRSPALVLCSVRTRRANNPIAPSPAVQNHSQLAHSRFCLRANKTAAHSRLDSHAHTYTRRSRLTLSNRCRADTWERPGFGLAVR